jgi:hypothetical protein
MGKRIRIMQTTGVTLTYKGSNSERPMYFGRLEEILEYFEHLRLTLGAQFTPESAGDVSDDIDRIEINMDAVSVRKLVADLNKEGIDNNVTTSTKTVEISEDYTMTKKFTYIGMDEYTVVITKP